MRSLFYFKKEDADIEKQRIEEFDVITVAELCELFKISKRYAYQFINENDIKHKKVGRKFFISKKYLEKFMKME